jgi:hypothetical protein
MSFQDSEILLHIMLNIYEAVCMHSSRNKVTRTPETSVIIKFSQVLWSGDYNSNSMGHFVKLKAN